MGILAFGLVRRDIRFFGTRGANCGITSGRVEKGAVDGTLVGRGITNMKRRDEVGSYGVTRGMVGTFTYGLTYNFLVGTIGNHRGVNVMKGFGVKCNLFTMLLGLGVFTIVLACQRELVRGIKCLRLWFRGLF